MQFPVGLLFRFFLLKLRELPALFRQLKGKNKRKNPK